MRFFGDFIVWVWFSGFLCCGFGVGSLRGVLGRVAGFWVGFGVVSGGFRVISYRVYGVYSGVVFYCVCGFYF